MLKTIKLLGGLLIVFAIGFLSSCNDDDDIGTGGSVPVADGFYVAKVGVTPTQFEGLLAEKVEGDGFATIDREGFFANHMYLTAGQYNIVNVIDQEIAQTYGGTIASATSSVDGSDCDAQNDYLLVEEYALNGASFAIPTAGFYKVMLDVSTKEIIFYQIESVQIIGGATEFGWGYNAGLELPVQGSISATGATFRGTNKLMKSGEWKVRFNCRWKVDRRIDPAAGFAAANGYVALTNLGGTLTNPVIGGSNFNINFGNDGKYTVEVKWTPAGKFVVTTTNTEPIAPKAVNSYDWGIVGSATPNGWPNDDTADDPIGVDHSLPLLGGSTTTTATYEIASIALSEGGEFKIRANKDWGIVLKPANSPVLGTVTGDSNFESTGGGDPNWKVKVGGAGNYKVTVATTNTGEKWNITFVKL